MYSIMLGIKDVQRGPGAERWSYREQLHWATEWVSAFVLRPGLPKAVLSIPGWSHACLTCSPEAPERNKPPRLLTQSLRVSGERRGPEGMSPRIANDKNVEQVPRLLWGTRPLYRRATSKGRMRWNDNVTLSDLGHADTPELLVSLSKAGTATRKSASHLHKDFSRYKPTLNQNSRNKSLQYFYKSKWNKWWIGISYMTVGSFTDAVKNNRIGRGCFLFSNTG